jgi:hypothetical protein
MIFAPTIINHTLPQVSVVNADSGVPPITYNQIKNSLGNQVYNIEKYYLQSNSLSQLIGQIQYNRYDVNGNKEFTTIATTVDPYQPASAIVGDLQPTDTYFILNGNSSLSTIILPLTMVDLTLYCKRITNQFGRNLNTFKIMEEIFRKPNFFKQYGDIDKIQITNEEIKKSASFSGDVGFKKEDDTAYNVLYLIVAGFGIFYLIKNKYV